MKCVAWYGKDDVRLEDRPRPEAGPGEVLLEVAYCGICGSDMHAINGAAISSGYRPGLVLGHEYSGKVLEVGQGVSRFRKGDLVLGAGGMPCGHCLECREGRSFRCVNGVRAKQGAWAEYVAMPEGFLNHIPAGVSLRVASLAEPVANAANTVETADIRLNEAVLILGAGTIGWLLMKLAKLRGAYPVIVSEPDDFKRQLAADHGADITINPRTQDVVAEVLTATQERGADVVLDAVGLPQTINQAIQSGRRGSRIFLHGVTPPGVEMSIEPYQFFIKLLTVRGITGLLWSHALTVLPRLNLEPMLSQPFPLEAIEDAVSFQRQGGAIKVILAPNGTHYGE